uniref:GB1/RHD3-type G domain-containing protein n=1 Tax=Arcella intermedia TaxID=1963864 RepID=A0A6B2KW57_9EUKA
MKPSEDRTKFIIDEDALSKLKSIKGPVVIVSVVGTQRGGKSTLLNLLMARKTSGFGLGHYLDPQTTGFWIWARKHPRNEDITIVLMDTEGLDSPHIPQWYNWTLAALAVLVSSYFIYQSKGSIDSSATDRLAVILQVAEQISGSKSEDSDQPFFTWLIRDHQLSFKKEPKEEMLGFLDRNEKRQLQNSFVDYTCFPLPRPVETEAMLKEVERLEWEDLRAEFREEYVVLERQIFSKVSNVRKMLGQNLTGELIGSLLEKYVSALSEKGIITDLTQLPTQQQMISKLSGERAVKAALEEYHKVMQPLMEKLPLSEVELAQSNHTAMLKARKVFLKEIHATSDEVPKDVKEYFEDLNNKIALWSSQICFQNGECVEQRKLMSGFYYDILKKNAEISNYKCSNEIKNLYSKISNKMNDITKNYSTPSEFWEDVHSFKDSFSNSIEAVGPFKSILLNEFVSTKIAQDGQRVALALLEKRMSDKLEAQEEALKKKIGENTERATKCEANISANIANLEKLDQQTISKVAELNSRISESDRKFANFKEDNSTKLEKMGEDFLKKLDNSQNQLSGKVNEVNDQNMRRWEDLRNKITASEEDNIKKLERVSNSLLATEGELIRRITENDSNLSKKLSEVVSSSEAKIKALNEELSYKLTSQTSDLNEKILKSNQLTKEIDLKFTSKTEEMEKRNANDLKLLETAINKSIETKNVDIQSLFDKQFITVNERFTQQQTQVTELSTASDKKFAAVSAETDAKIKEVSTLLSDLAVKSASDTSEINKRLQLHSENLSGHNQRLDEVTVAIRGLSEETVNKIQQNAKELELKLSSNSALFEEKLVHSIERIDLLSTKTENQFKLLSIEVKESKEHLDQKLATTDLKMDKITTELRTDINTTHQNLTQLVQALQNTQESTAHQFLEFNEKMEKKEAHAKELEQSLFKINGELNISKESVSVQSNAILEQNKSLELLLKEHKANFDKLQNLQQQVTQHTNYETKINNLNLKQSDHDSNIAEIHKTIEKLTATISEAADTSGSVSGSVKELNEKLARFLNTLELTSLQTENNQQSLGLVSTNLGQLNEKLSKEEERYSALENALINLQNATSITFVNIESTFGQILQKIASDQAALEKIQEIVDEVVSKAKSNVDMQFVENTVMKSIAGMTQANNKYTDSAVEELKESIKKMIHNDLPKIKKEETPSTKNDNTSEFAARLGTYERDRERDKEKLGDLYSKIANILGNISSLQQSLEELQSARAKTTTGVFPKPEANTSEIQEIVEEQLTVQREQLVAALKTHVSQIEYNMRVEFNKSIEATVSLIHNLEKRIEGYGNASEGTGNIIGLEEKFRKTLVQMNNFKTSVEALWNYSSQLTSRMTMIEAEVDKFKIK